MTHKIGLALTSALVLAAAGMFGSVSASVARTARDISQAPTDISAQAKPQDKGNAGQRSAAPRSAAPRSAAPRGGGPSNAGQRSMGQRSMGQRSVSQPSMGQRSMGQRSMGQRSMGQRSNIQRSTIQRSTIQRGTIRRGTVQRSTIQRGTIQRGTIQRGAVQRGTVQRNIGQRSTVQRSISQSGRGLRAASIRGASRLSISGRNYSIWRGSHRVRRAGGWRTFVALSALGGLAIGGATYYPYAYIDAPAPLCEGLTEDGCQLQWQQVQTIEGDVDFQCVAYCPWQ